MRVLVTGGGGFIGSHVVGVLARQGHAVFAVLRRHGLDEDAADSSGEVHAIRVDLNDAAGLASAVREIRPDTAIHLAWYTQPAKYWSAPENLESVAMSLNLARVLAESGCKRLIAAGSCAEYEWRSEILSEERTPLRPRTLYGVCKNALREILDAYCQKAPMQLAWLRFFYLYGPGEARGRLVPSTILSLLSGKPVPFASGEQARDYIHVEDAARAVAAVVESQESGCINVGSGQPIKIRTIVEKIARILDRRDLVGFGAIADNPSEPSSLAADVCRLRHRCHWKPSLTFDEGILQTVNWWKANS
jgi:nucleoside-diphosphate-sugar epimerase